MGTTAIWLSRNFAYVIAVEADKDSVGYLKKNITASQCNNVIICDKAIADIDTFVTFGPRLSMNHGDALNGSTSFVKNTSDSNSDYAVEALSFAIIIDRYVNTNETVNKYPISFIKCDIEGGEEMILAPLLEFALTHNCKVWMSFHIPWWEKKDISEFAELFRLFKTNIETNDIIAHIKANPFESILFEPLSNLEN